LPAQNLFQRIGHHFASSPERVGPLLSRAGHASARLGRA
jgi:hypothetical protein